MTTVGKEVGGWGWLVMNKTDDQDSQVVKVCQKLEPGT